MVSSDYLKLQLYTQICHSHACRGHVIARKCRSFGPPEVNSLHVRVASGAASEPDSAFSGYTSTPRPDQVTRHADPPEKPITWSDLRASSRQPLILER